MEHTAATPHKHIALITQWAADTRQERWYFDPRNPHLGWREEMSQFGWCEAVVYELRLPGEVRDWITWSGGECPVHGKSLVKVLFRNGGMSWANMQAMNYGWNHNGQVGDILSYLVTEEHVEAPPQSQITIDEGFFAGGKINIDPNLPANTLEIRGENTVRINMDTLEVTTDDCMPATPPNPHQSMIDEHKRCPEKVVQYYSRLAAGWENCPRNKPLWDHAVKYRFKLPHQELRDMAAADPELKWECRQYLAGESPWKECVPVWLQSYEYRPIPKTRTVQKWLWLLESPNGSQHIPSARYSATLEEAITFAPHLYKVLRKLEWSVEPFEVVV